KEEKPLEAGVPEAEKEVEKPAGADSPTEEKQVEKAVKADAPKQEKTEEKPAAVGVSTEKKDAEKDQDKKPDTSPGNGLILVLLALIAVVGIVILLPQIRKGKNAEATPKEEAVTESSSKEIPEEITNEEEAEPVSWEETYKKYLMKELDRYGEGLNAFSICDLDEDDIPELLLWYKEDQELELLTWYEDQVAVCSVGKECTSVDEETGITWDERTHVIYSSTIGENGKSKKQYVKLADGELEPVTDKDRQSLNHPVNYLLANAYEPTEKVISKVLDSWKPGEDTCGSTPKKKEKSKPTPTPTPVPAEAPQEEAEPAPQTEPVPEPAPQATILHPYNPINVRALSDHNSGLVCEINDVNTNLYYYNEVGQGYGSDGQLHYWYKIYLDNGLEGWVRSDLVY
ncbi:MAG: hypothetical protein MJ117_08365, partial [Lachnospiraceae bacterium]|nr:hypothetical protein [Lachnospiraceae bacterium]